MNCAILLRQIKNQKYICQPASQSTGVKRPQEQCNHSKKREKGASIRANWT